VSAPATGTHPAGDTVAGALAVRYPYLTPGQCGLLGGRAAKRARQRGRPGLRPGGHPTAAGLRPRHQRPRHRQRDGAVTRALPGPGGFSPPQPPKENPRDDG
jgi:hypothetical protein